MPVAPFHPKALIRLLALAALALACSERYAQGMGSPTHEGLGQATSWASINSQANDHTEPAPDELATPPQAAAEPMATLESRTVVEPEARDQLTPATPGDAEPEDATPESVGSEDAVLPVPKPHRPGMVARWLLFLWTALLLLSDPQAAVGQPAPLPVGPQPGLSPPTPPWPSAPLAPTLVAPPAFLWPPPQGGQPANPWDQAGATAALNDALAQILHAPLPIANATQLLANLTGARVATTTPSIPSAPPNQTAVTANDPTPLTDLEAATTALFQTATFVQGNVLVPGSNGGPGLGTSAQVLAQFSSLQGQLNAALALRSSSLPNTSDAGSNALWDGLAAFAGIASAALASPTDLNNAALAAATASEIDETITNIINLYNIANIRIPAIEVNLQRFAKFSTRDGSSPETSGIGPPSIRYERHECFNCTMSCNFEQNVYQYATAVNGVDGSTINLLAYIYFFIKGVELAALETAMLANATVMSAPSSNGSAVHSHYSWTGGSPPGRRLLQANSMEPGNSAEGVASGPDATSSPPPPTLQFPAPLNRYASLQPPGLPALLPLDTVSVQEVLNQLGITGHTPYDPGCTQCCYLDVNKPMLAASRIAVVTAWLNAIGAGLFGLRVDLAIQAYLETLDPSQRTVALGGIRSNITQLFNEFFQGATPPPPGSSDPGAASDLNVLQAAMAQIAKTVGSSGAPPSPEQLSGILAAAMQTRLSAMPGTNTNLTDIGWYGLQALTNMAARMPSAVTVKLVTGSLGLAQQWIADSGYLLRLLSNAVGIEANQIAAARTAKILLDSANNQTASSVYPEPGNDLCASRECVRECNRLNFQIQYGAAKIRLVSAQIGGVAYILAITANFINLGIDANQIINAIIEQLNAASPANLTTSHLHGVPFGVRFQVQSTAAAAPAITADSFEGLIEPMDASLASAMNLTQVIALPQAFLSADTFNGLPIETYGLPGVIELVEQYLRASNITDSCLPCCNIENSVEILDTDVASLLSSQFVFSGYVLTDVAAGIRIGIQGITDISLLPTLLQAINATLAVPAPPPVPVAGRPGPAR